MSRDRDFEWRILASTVRAAASRFGVDCTPYAEAVMQRLRLGAERFGDGAFRERDPQELITELCEEPPDVGGWGLLALQTLGETAAREALLEAMLHGALADHYAREVARLVKAEANG